MSYLLGNTSAWAEHNAPLIGGLQYDTNRGLNIPVYSREARSCQHYQLPHRPYDWSTARRRSWLHSAGRKSNRGSQNWGKLTVQAVVRAVAAYSLYRSLLSPPLLQRSRLSSCSETDWHTLGYIQIYIAWDRVPHVITFTKLVMKSCVSEASVSSERQAKYIQFLTKNVGK